MSEFLAPHSFAVLVILSLGACAAQALWLGRVKKARVPWLTWLFVGLLLVLAWQESEWAGQRQESQVKRTLQSFASLYAFETEKLGHGHLRAEPATALLPEYLKMIEVQKQWQAMNPLVNDIYTIRKLPDGRDALVVDSETDYDRNGRIEGEREQRTRPGEIFREVTLPMEQALAGEATLDFIPATDRWGTWVSAFQPLRDEQGRVEAILGVDFEAKQLWHLIYSSQRRVLYSVGLMLTVVLGASTLTSVLRAEDRTRRRVLAELHASEENFRQLVQALPTPLVVCDAQGRLTLRNRAAAELWVQPPSLGQPEQAGTLLTLTGVPLGPAEMPLAETLRTGKACHGRELRGVGRDGAPLSLLSYTEPLQRGSTHTAGALHILVDVTDLRATERKLTQEMEQRRQAELHLLRSQRMESVGTLASGMAHDLNNTISPILMAAQLLHHELTVELRDHMVRTIESSAERAAGIVKQVLTFARGEEGERVLLDPRALLHELESIVAGLFPRNITIRLQAPPGLGLLQGDRTLLHQVLLNVCLNARDAMPEGGCLVIGADEVEWKASEPRPYPEAEPGPWLRIRISDTGRGIPPEAMAKIFDPFFTTKELGKGTGLGLSMVASIVKAHGGIVDVESEVDLGTMFSIFLPCYSPGSREKTLPKMEAEAGPLPTGHGETILVVDDEEAIREAVTLVLRRQGYQVLTAANGAEGLALYASAEDRIVLIISDLMMPVSNGVEFIRGVRRLDQRLPVIVASGYADEGKLRDLRTLHIQAMLAKPYKMEALLETISQVLEEARAAVV